VPGRVVQKGLARPPYHSAYSQIELSISSSARQAFRAGAGCFIGAQREDPALEKFRDNMRKRYGEWLAREQGLINREHVVDPDTIHKARPDLGVGIVKTIKK